MRRATVDLPEPDSPTRPSVSPFLMSRETSSMALTSPTCFLSQPSWMGKYFLRPRTENSTSSGREREVAGRSDIGGLLDELIGNVAARHLRAEALFGRHPPAAGPGPGTAAPRI